MSINTLDLPTKERLIVKSLRNFIENDEEYRVALVTGIRRVGKTTALRQLNKFYTESYYVDFLGKKRGTNGKINSQGI